MIDGIMLLWFLLTAMAFVVGSRLIDLEPEHDSCFESDSWQKDLRPSVIEGGDTAPILQASCGAFDAPVSAE